MSDRILGHVPFYDDNPYRGVYVYLCHLCGQPLAPGATCGSAMHVGPSGETRGQAVRSTVLAEHRPACGDAIHRWLKKESEGFREGSVEWATLHWLRGRYTEKADYGLRLDEEGGDP